MIKTITSKDNEKVKYACSLKESKYRKKYQQFLGETFNSLDMAIEAGIVTDVFVLEWKNLPEGINQYLVSEDVLKKIAFSVTPEVVFIANIIEKKPAKLDKLIYLDHVSDPGNIGTIIRTALAFNYDAVILSEDSCSIYNEKVISASKGAIYKLPVFVGNILEYNINNKVIVSTLNDKSVSIFGYQAPEKFVLVLGNESHGVSEPIMKLADDFVKIPITNIDSLNVSVAGGILMAELIK